jgi:hypothetical protein
VAAEVLFCADEDDQRLLDVLYELREPLVWILPSDVRSTREKQTRKTWVFVHMASDH